MRYLIAILATFAALAAQASNLHGRMLVHECRQIEPARDGFKCALEKHGDEAQLKIHHTSGGNAGPDEKEHKVNALLVRYIDARGKVWRITSDKWPQGEYLYCWTGKIPYTTYCEKKSQKTAH